MGRNGVIGAAVLAAISPVAAAAQSAPQVGSREVVQPLPPRAADDLSSALRRLGTNALDGRAMLDAGWASLELDDVTAAVGFFSRAQELPQFAGEAKAGLGAAQVFRKRPLEALVLFDEADAAGVKLGKHAAVRGLAYDMVGDNARAQPFYRVALQAGGLSDEKEQEITRQLALSQAIGGDQAGSEATLLPLLNRRDLAAYRTRAFALAALGKTEEAVSIANAVMPASLAGRIAPYLRYMPKLTRAQQAAAGNFGQFPDADMIGKDDPAIAQYAAQARPVQVAAAPLDARLTPSGAPLGTSDKGKGKPASPPVGTVIALSDKGGADKGRADRGKTPQPASGAKVPAQTPPPVIAQQPAAVAAQPVPAPQPAFSQPPSSGSQVALASPPAAAAQSAPLPAIETPPPAPASLVDAFAEFASGPAKAAPAPGAVDITRIAVRREPDRKAEAEKAKAEAEKAKAEAKAEADRKAEAARKKAEAEKRKLEAEKKAEAKKKAANPSRVWVQVGTGQNRSAIAFTWRKFQKEQSKLFGSRKGYVAAWGRTNRLLTGPFSSAKEANAFIKQLKAAGIDCFIFTSDAGEEVSPVS
ncbi:tetratricopeptide repeat protein [Altererythrobacter sp. CC-YST694]|uniref:tetratricopeptide repeat protein n=1 Tax=Altererythrobacter sp. CC-YST694 TaxID=2755038 RepID=UPI001D0336E6|nr:tetratricopeptide repeat protein [Altererythrobacter sp. CC-YST694]MCB5426294.1 tetratricopeptide repeat protein [Altererythrobacter sp. CC-YST694]